MRKIRPLAASDLQPFVSCFQGDLVEGVKGVAERRGLGRGSQGSLFFGPGLRVVSPDGTLERGQVQLTLQLSEQTSFRLRFRLPLALAVRAAVQESTPLLAERCHSSGELILRQLGPGVPA